MAILFANQRTLQVEGVPLNLKVSHLEEQVHVLVDRVRAPNAQTTLRTPETPGELVATESALSLDGDTYVVRFYLQKKE